MLWVTVALWVAVTVAIRNLIAHGKPPVWFTFILIFVACWATTGQIRHAYMVGSLELAVSPVADRDVNIHCKNEYLGQFATSRYTGYVPYEAGDPLGTGTDVFLRSSVCDTLAEAIDNWDTTVEYAAAVQVLTHEAKHVAGEKDEAAAECAAMQEMAGVAVRLGAPRDVARKLAVTYHRSLYERMPSEYQSGECVKGGKLDLKLGDGPWD